MTLKENLKDLRKLGPMKMHQLAIFILYDYGRRERMNNAIELFLKKHANDPDYFAGKLYLCYMEEMKTLEEDLFEGGNDVTKELCLKLWFQYRKQFREKEFSTMAVVKATPQLCHLHGIEYAGPVIF